MPAEAVNTCSCGSVKPRSAVSSGPSTELMEAMRPTLPRLYDARRGPRVGMQALFKAAPEPGALELREVPRPVPAPDEVVVDVAGASICGSDLHIALWHPMARWTRPPVIMGHEFAGVVAEVGS